MIDRFFASRGRAAAAAISAFVALAGVTAAGAGMAACSSDSVSVDQQIQSFCTSYVGSQGFACCNAADKGSSAFASRYRYGTVDACQQALGGQLSTAAGAQTFDSAAAASCLQYTASRACGAGTLLADRIAAEKAGCRRVLKGLRTENAPCQTADDCEAGLFCPSTAETGVAVCAKPAGLNQTCYQNQIESTDHPACTDGLVCLFNTTVAVCPVPPCPEYRCVPRVTVAADTTQAEACTGTDCVSTATCTDLAANPTTGHQFVCQNGTAGAPAGKGCLVSEQCATGLFCDTSKGICAAQKANGQPCSPGNNKSIFECTGICSDAGTCTSFCGKG